MLHHLDKRRGTLLSKVFLSGSGADLPVKKILTWTAADGEKPVWPEPATHLRMESNYDAAANVKLEDGAVYGHPVVNPEADDYVPLEVTVTPHPANSGWKLSAENFDLGAEAGATHYGPATLTFEVPKPDVIGHHLHRITVRPEYGDAEPVTLSFWSVRFSESKLAPVHWWSFDGSDFTDKAGGITLVQENATATPVFTDGVTKKAFQASYVAGGANPNSYSAGITPEYADNGLSVCGFGKFSRGGEFGLIDPTNSNSYEGHHLAVGWGYRQPNCMLPEGHGQPVPATTAADRVESGKWHHLAVTLSKPIDPRNHENFAVDFVNNQYGTFTYTSPDVEYSRTCASTQYTDYFTYSVRLARFYIDGILKGELLVVLSPATTAVPGRGHFSLSMENAEEQDGSNPDTIDEIKLFEKELSLAEIRSECALIGLQFLNDNPTGTEGGRIQKIGRDGRKRLGKPEDLATVPLACRLKAFLIDDRTVAVGGVFREFFLDRLKTEYPNLDATEFNYRNGFIADYLRRFHYMYDLWELYNDYQPRIVDAMDDAANWSCDGNPVELIGRWQNSTGTMRFDDFLDGADYVELDCADIVHFGYLRLPVAMAEGTAHTVAWNGNTVEFTYGRDRYASSIKVNQEGYLPDAGRKYAYFGLWLGTGGAYRHSLSELTFHVLPAGSDIPAFTGTMTKRETASTHTKNDVTFLLTGEETYVCDFSALQAEGEYQIYIPGVGYSHKFRIGQAALGKAFWTHCRGLFHHRSGCSGVVKPHTNWEYPKPAHHWTWESKFICDDTTYDLCATPDGVTYPALFSNKHFSMIPNNATGRLFRDLRGGWYDAADFDRRPYHFLCVRDLVEAYLRFPENFTDGQLDLPESGNGIPDILSEAEWGLDVWRRGQRGDGGVAAWIEANGHESDWPWRSGKKYYIGLANRKDSLEYAQCAAKFARALRIAGTPEALAKADVYTESAVRAFNFGIDPANAAALAFTQKNSANAEFDFSYAEPDGPAKRLVVPAAAALFVLTGEPRFAKEITPENFEAHYTWLRDDANDFAQHCASEFLFDLDAHFPAYAARLKEFIVGKADQWRSYQEMQTYREMTWPPDHAFYNFLAWGVGHPERRGKAFVYAWMLTGDAKYRDSALVAMDNVAGCNAMGRCITTGLGKVSPIHHLDSWLPRAEHELKVYEPVPGITPYTFIGDLSGKATGYGFCLYKGGRDDMSFAEMTRNILPGGNSHAVANARGSVAVWLQTHWPLWRNVFDMEGQIVAQSEFTVAETISGKAFMTGCLMGAGFTPDPAWKERTPSTDKYAVEGLVYLP